MAIVSTGRRSKRTQKSKNADEMSNTRIILLVIFIQCIYQTYRNLKISVTFVPVDTGFDPSIRRQQEIVDTPRIEPPPKTEAPTSETTVDAGAEEEEAEEEEAEEEEAEEEEKAEEEEEEDAEEKKVNLLSKLNKLRSAVLKKDPPTNKETPTKTIAKTAEPQRELAVEATHRYKKAFDHRFSDPLSDHWVYALQEAEKMLRTNNNSNSNSTSPDNSSWKAECLIPDVEGTAKRTDIILRSHNARKKMRKTRKITRQLDAQIDKPYADPLIHLPIINVGMPKLGSTTLHKYFSCKGFNSTHWTENTDFFEGLCMRDAVRAGLPPLKTCAKGTHAMMQLDVTFPFGSKNKRFGGPGHNSHQNKDDCFFPQLSILEEMHEENKYATFILTFRPMKDWIKSVTGWYSLMERLRDCNLPNLPRGVPDLSRYKKNDPTEIEEVMTHFFCSHVIHVRNFVKRHPTHNLIELDLYDNRTEAILDQIFPSLATESEETDDLEESKKEIEAQTSGEDGDEYEEPDDGDDDIMNDDDDRVKETPVQKPPVESCWKHSNRSNETRIGRGKKRKNAKRAKESVL